MYEHYIRTTLLEHITKPCEHVCCHIGKILALFHDVEVDVWSNLKDFEHLIKHFTMLAGYAYDSLKLL